ncbi:glutamate--tRNA ligase [Entomophthora muscae]|uniref:Glutamate--tRNA ligase n=1 Tax=Entomophthora muscae TaxID=34485 RepID=A0ACC2SIL0_9FUNG|nr:glutamate--tRNA ligase [Entomophthora muscae]
MLSPILLIIFQTLHDLAIKLIKKGLAYVDDTDQATMRIERMKGIASKNRERPIEENLKLFEEMKQGTEFGLTACLRSKMSVDDKNKALRDPVIYRCNLTPHHRTGETWKVYPTYDFACPAVDSIEGVTHALRTNEYRDRNPQYQWFLDALELRQVYIWDFSRLNFVYTLLSKRKLQQFVDDGLVTGWDDPRFPTVRGIRRRGMTVDALKQYILMQGASQSTMLLEWDKLWALNKKAIDPVAPRFVALVSDRIVPVKITGHEGPDSKEIPRHKKNLELGNKVTSFSSNILLEHEDAKDLSAGEEVTLMDWGNAIVEEVKAGEDGSVESITMKLHLEGDFKKTKKKLTWLASTENLVPCTLVDYDYLITKKKLEETDEVKDFITPTTEFLVNATGDANIKSLKNGDILQLERKGYYIVDAAYSQEHPSVKFIFIPDGKAKSMASKADKTEASDKPVNSKKAANKEKKKEKKKQGGQPPVDIIREDGITKALKHLQIKCMYTVPSLFKGMIMPPPEECTSMYKVKYQT